MWCRYPLVLPHKTVKGYFRVVYGAICSDDQILHGVAMQIKATFNLQAHGEFLLKNFSIGVLVPVIDSDNE